MKTFYTFIITAYCLFIFGNNNAATLKGTGTQADPFQIATLNDLQLVSEDRDFWDEHLVLVADIDASATKNWNLADHDGDEETPEVYMGFKPIGHYHSLPTRFQGSFDGQGHTISNLYIYHQNSSGDHAGLFGSVQTDFFIKNVNLVNIDFTCRYGGGLVSNIHKGDVSNCHSSGVIKGSWGYIGGLIGATGDMENEATIHIENCSSSCQVGTINSNNSGTTYVGGFIGNAYSYHNDKEFIAIKNCNASGDVIGHPYSNNVGGFAGGITDSVYVENCIASGNVQGAYVLGGFVGICGGAYGRFINCHAYGEIEVISEHSNKSRIGGFVGALGSGTIIDKCSSTAKEIIAGNHTQVGGFVGAFVGGGNSTIQNCFALANITASERGGGFLGDGSGQAYSVLTTSNCYAKGNVSVDKYYAGGFAAYSGEVAINCVAYGNVSCPNAYQVGGFYGRGSGAILSGCYAYGNVTGLDRTGGFAGSLSMDSIINCHALQTHVSGTEKVGGFTGEIGSGKIHLSSARAHINGTANYIGGFIGYCQASCYDCSASGNVSANAEYVGGFFGSQTNGSATQCFSMGNVYGQKYAGGFAGSGKVANASFACGDVYGKSFVGGFVGGNYMDANTCFSSGNVFGSVNDVAGFTGSRGIFLHCYTSSKISGPAKETFGIAAYSGYSGARNNYFDNDYNSGLVGVPNNSYPDNHKGIPSAAFANEQSFNEWDFDAMWKIGTIPSIDIYPRPYHQWYIKLASEFTPFHSVEINQQMAEAVVNPAQQLISIYMPYGADLSELMVQFTLPEGMVLVVNDSVYSSGIGTFNLNNALICYFRKSSPKSAIENELETTEMWILEAVNSEYLVEIKSNKGGEVLGDTLQFVVPDSSSRAVLAVPDKGFTFLGWKNTGDEIISTNDTLILNTVTANASITAIFEEASAIFTKTESNFVCAPNPFNQKLKVIFNGNYSGSIALFNLSGQKLFESKESGVKTVQINTEKLRTGVYILKTSQGCRKLVKP